MRFHICLERLVLLLSFGCWERGEGGAGEGGVRGGKGVGEARGEAGRWGVGGS